MPTLLVANRGEIAVRVFRTARRLALRTVAVYSDADEGAPHVRAADTAVRIGPAPATESYLRIDRVIDAARSTGAELIHPGYGFLAEDDAFAQACEESGIAFVGPPSKVLRVVGDKAASRALAEEAGVPVFAGYAGDEQDDAALRAHASRIGFPLIVKPSAGGGGKGMAVVAGVDELDDALASARRIASGAFGDDRLILERYVAGPRHVEVQVFGDAAGSVIHLGERDCSLQRRHQKILEESPAPNLDAAVRERLHDAAVAFATHAGYVGAGTCEFLVSAGGDIGFIEMNARLQVEHPVTEMVTGLDLVELQLKVAMGERLGIAQSDVSLHGHAIEARVYAEDPDGFLPQAGRVLHVRWPNGVRVDTGIEEGTEVSTHYDPLVAKLVVHTDDRADALEALRHAIRETELLGPRTNLTFLADVLDDPAVVAGTITTDWLDRREAWRWPRSPDDESLAWMIAAGAELHDVLQTPTSDPWTALGPWRAGGSTGVPIVLRDTGGSERVLSVQGRGPFVVRNDGGTAVVRRDDDRHGWRIGEHGARAATARDETDPDAVRRLVWISGMSYELLVGPAPRRLAAAAGAHVVSPLPGQVVKVLVTSGQQVQAGDELVVVEAMKMEHSITAPVSGTVHAVLCAPGDQVDRGRSLVDFEPDA
jgi:3-methylcrotonyl-CoA carboxylase alpha subunit